MNSPALRTENAAIVPLWKIAAVVAGLSLFAGCFYQFDLPNSDPRVNRLEIWKQLPSLLVNMVDPPQPGAQDIEARLLWKQAGWQYWPQRFGMYGVAGGILLGAWAWGSVVLRALRIPLARGSLDWIFFACATGLSLVSLTTLACGLAGWLSRPLLAIWLAIGLVLEISDRLMRPSHTEAPRRSWTWSEYWPVLIAVPFLMCYVGGAFLPETDFDVNEYHFGGPKEWYLAGRITFLAHNVYTSFPFLTEMLTLLGMVLYGDWYWGAVAGKGVLMSFAPLTALGLYCAGRRWFSPAAGLWAAWIHLSTPWIYRISIIAYAEGGLAFYLFATLFAVLYLVESPSGANSTTNPETSLSGRRTWSVLAGFLAGSGMACKYPGVVQVVLPLGLTLLRHAASPSEAEADVQKQRRDLFRLASLYAVGVLCAVGPWLLKNLLQTGNPVYPLLYSVFGGIDWNAELNAKWKHGHSPDHYQLVDLAVKLMDVTLKSDWLSPLLFGLAPLALLSPHRRLAARLWWYTVYLFGAWWLLTHRIDRFWVPLIPVVSLLAGVGATWTSHRIWRSVVCGFAAAAMTFNFAFMTTSLCGYNAYLLDLQRAAEQTARITSPEVVHLNLQLPPGAKVLCIGEAELFNARFRYVYNTVFDFSIFEQWCGADQPGVDAAQRPLKTAAEIRRRLAEQGITHLFVNWQEILRYRLTYGYTDFVTPQKFQQLQAEGVLGTGWPTSGQLFEKLDARSQREVRSWGPELIEQHSGPAVFRTFDVYPVLSSP